MPARIQHKRERLDVAPADLLARLPAMGRVMIGSENRGATHERIGRIEKVRVADGWAIFEGAEHDSCIELAAIASLVADRSSIMREKSYPRLELKQSDGRTIANITGFEGLEPFDAVLAAFPQGAALDVEERRAGGTDERRELDEDDAGLRLLSAAARAGGHVRVEFSRPSFRQCWAGAMPAIKPAMGYVNIIQPDFHLHLKGGSVSGWRREEADGVIRFHALGLDGGETGLVVCGAACDFR
ncbi:MAG: hypothetical protein WA975_02480 [Mesorhizobium sp.]